ncbi:MAG: cytochrome c family protein [Methyloceanibacter sp.]|nr:cytochrome c family protein [Methyloceanibacter sp.]
MWPSLRSALLSVPLFAACVLLAGLQSALAQTLDDRLAKANPAKGQEVFLRCGTCHTVEEGGRDKIGPNLWGIINRAVASDDDFRYSEALQEYGGSWELERLDEFLADPAGTVPGTRMMVPGVTDDAERSDLIAYLNQNSANPLPIGLDPELAEAEAAASDANKKRDFGLMVDAPGVEKTYALCTPCHSEMIIVQQGKTRKRWDKALDWMIEEQGMAPLSNDDREVVLDYLEANYNEDRPNFPKR